MAVETPPEYGGCGSTFFASVLTIEAVSKVDPSVGVVVDLQNTLFNAAFMKHGTKKQKEKYLPGLASDYVSS